MFKKIDWVYILVIIVCVILALSVYQKAEAGVMDWFSREVVITLEPEPEKTTDSEIDRLAIKYDVSSSTVRAIIKCESSMYPEAINRNRDANGVVWSSDWGLMQINDYYHEKVMTNLGLDIHNKWDSLEYGFILLKEQGLKPWSASATCRKKMLGI